MISIASNTTIEWLPKKSMGRTGAELGPPGVASDGANAPSTRDFESAARAELPVLYRVARRLCRREEDAEDLVHQCLLQACRGWKRFDGRHLRSWLIRILRNEHLGRSKSSRLNEDALPLEPHSAVSEAPWDAIAYRDQADRLLAELDALPEEYRMAVQLCDVEELSYAEAAQAMGVPMGTVRSRLFRGRTLIRTRFQAKEAKDT